MQQKSGEVSLLRRYRTPILILVVVLAIPLWWLFRPERLFVNQQVNETPPPELASLQPVFTGSLRSPGEAAPPVHGRVNIVKSSRGLEFEISNLESAAAKSFTVSLAPSPDASAHARTIGEVNVGGQEALPIPSGIDPKTYKTVFLMSNGQIAATAMLEAF